MIERIQPAIRGVILDMDGVLWKDNLALIDMPALFAGFEARGIQVTLATNNATRTVDSVVERLAKFGAQVAPVQVFTSGMAVTYLLKQHFPSGGPVYVIGEDGLISSLAAGGFYPAVTDVLAVVAGLDRSFTYQKMRAATMLIRAGVPFYGTNPDATFPTPEGLVPGAGSVLAGIQIASGVTPILAGKPQPALFLMAMEAMHLTPDQTLVVGDRLDTDILGGQRAGCRTALVLSGVSTALEAAAWQPHPDLILPDVSSLLSLEKAV